MIDYKWTTYAKRQHLIGGFVHLVYVLVLIQYISHTFLDLQAVEADHFVPMHAVKKDDADARRRKAATTLEGDPELDDRIFPPCDVRYMYAIAACLVYPIFYEATQLAKQGSAYFAQASNYIAVCHIFFGVLNIYCQVRENGTWNIWSKIVMIVVIATCLLTTFFFMRIFVSFSYIVTMITNVVIDLKIFLVFFFILIVMFSMIFDVITRNEAAEYSKIGYWWGNFFTTLRLALGDFDFGMIEDKTLTKQHYLFWITWLLMVIFSSLIFLNFIIAEVSSSYNTVKRNISALIYKERAALINEAEDVASKKTKMTNKKEYPRYIVVREMEH
jgi:hypothetical protein